MGALVGREELRTEEQPGFMVTLPDFYMAETEVTQGLWYEVMGTNPSFFQGDDSLPVDNVSWNDGQKFVKKLSEMTGASFRLPTETICLCVTTPIPRLGHLQSVWQFF